MKPEELRIGNLIQTDNSTEHFMDVEKVESIQHDGINITDGIGNTYETEFSYDFINPIPITEKWLLALGFDVVSYIATGDFIINGTKRLVPVNDYEYNIIVYALDYDKWCLKIETNPRLEEKHRKEVNLSLKHFKYIHQLQNLYYALTHSELARVDG